MDLYYVMDADLKKKYLNEWLKKQVPYQKRVNVGKVLKIIGLIVFLFLELFFVRSTINSGALLVGIGAGFGVGTIFGCIPFFIGQSIVIKAKKEYGVPYIKMEKEYLSISNEGIQFGYHNMDSRYTDSMDIYQISKEEINAIRIDQLNKIVTIIGTGHLTAYDDILSKRINYEKSKRRFYSNSPYSFILGFDKNDEVIKILKDIAKNKEVIYG